MVTATWRFQRGKYEDKIQGNSTFEDGDWNGDGDFDSSDLVHAFQTGNYVAFAVARKGGKGGGSGAGDNGNTPLCVDFEGAMTGSGYCHGNADNVWAQVTSR